MLQSKTSLINDQKPKTYVRIKGVVLAVEKVKTSLKKPLADKRDKQNERGNS